MSLALMLKCTFLQHPSFYVQQNKTFLNMLPVTSKLMSLRPPPGGTDSQFHRRKEHRKSSKLLKLIGDLRKEENYITLFGLKKKWWVSFKATKLEDSWKSWSGILQLFISLLIERQKDRGQPVQNPGSHLLLHSTGLLREMYGGREKMLTIFKSKQIFTFLLVFNLIFTYS